MKNKENIMRMKLSGWGRTSPVFSNIFNPINLLELKNKIKNANTKSLITRGLGRSYGDAAQLQDKNVITLSNFKGMKLCLSNSTLKAGAGISFEEILKYIIPKGFFLPVTPGTRNVTVGGAIATDVHGKNHHIDGSFGNHVTEIKIIDGEGHEKTLTPNNENETLVEQFWATIGGMGLTGVIYEATFKLIKIKTSLISVDTSRFEDIDTLMNAMYIADKKYQYSVAWVDSLHHKTRGVLTCGDHAHQSEIKDNSNHLFYDPKAFTSTPSFLPNGLLNKFTVKLFNETWYRKAPVKRRKELQTIPKFFHPLDGVKNWNKIYGNEGFIQYQFAIPDSASYLVSKSLEVLRDANAPSFLTVLKRFGKRNKGYLSFPIKGWTLAVDIPASNQKLNSSLNYLDKLIANEGGRLYLAKDSRQSVDMFLKTYRTFNEWLKIKNEMDPRNIFTSDLAERLDFF